MPNTRAKSCDNCRVAKSRCSLSSPCSRCAKRCLQCHYPQSHIRHVGNQQRRGDFRPILPVTIAPITIDKIVNNGRLHTDNSVSIAEISDAVVADAGNYFASSDKNSDENSFHAMATLLGTGTKMPDLAIYQSDAFSPFDISATSTFSNGMISSPDRQRDSDNSSVSRYFVDTLLISDPLSLSYSMPDFGLSTASSPMPASIGLNSPDFLMTMTDSDDTPAKPPLSMRERSFQQGSLTAKMILNQLFDYTRRIAEGRNLPPFIHPPCFLSQNDECPAEAPHSCLPQPLAICRNLTQMFYSRTSESTSFIWRQIFSHLHEMRAEHNDYDTESLLQALQAILIYGLLCSQSTESVQSEDINWMISTTEIFARQLYSISSYDRGLDYASLSRSKWVFVESQRRTACLMYLMDLLLHIKGQTPSKGQCPEFIDLPLPCTRELWQPISDRDWRKRYNEENNSKLMKGNRGLTMGNLFLLRQSLSRGENVLKTARADLAREMAEWVEKVDDLSMLLWMAVALEGDGQAMMIQGTLAMG
ncbi:hypothetical protein ACQKWADRAFT_297589 [Trichoderma austrokoningii]